MNEFECKLTILDKKTKEEKVNNLDINNFLPRGSKLKSTISCIGIVVYTGFDTKLMLNTKLRNNKISSLESQVNRYIVIIFIIIIVLITFFASYGEEMRRRNVDFLNAYMPMGHSYTTEWFILFFNYFVLINTLLPISVVVTLNLSRLI